MIKVKKISTKQLTRTQSLALISYGEDYGKFTALLDNGVLYVNRNVKDEDVQKFLEIAESTERYLMEPGGKHEETVVYLSKNYPAVFDMLNDAHMKKISMIKADLADKRVVEVFSKIKKCKDDIDEYGSEDPLNEYMIDAMHRYAHENGYKTDDYVFYLGYLIGTGEVTKCKLYAGL